MISVTHPSTPGYARRGFLRDSLAALAGLASLPLVFRRSPKPEPGPVPVPNTRAHDTGRAWRDKLGVTGRATLEDAWRLVGEFRYLGSGPRCIFPKEIHVRELPIDAPRVSCRELGDGPIKHCYIGIELPHGADEATVVDALLSGVGHLVANREFVPEFVTGFLHG